MKWYRSAAGLLLCCAIAARADLQRWIQDIASPGALQAVFFRSMPLPGGAVDVRRPPKETRVELGKLISAAPSQADLYSLRAHEDELQLDFTAAENDWKKYVELAPDKITANLALADFYHRRIQSAEEIAALEVVGRSPVAEREKLKPSDEQQSWKAFARIQTVIAEQALPVANSIAEFRAWIARYPGEAYLYDLFFEELTSKGQFAEAERLLADYRRLFPANEVFPVHAAAALAAKRGSPNDELRIYDQNFRPLWPQALVESYFTLLKQTHSLRIFLEQARAQIAAKPADIAPVARVYYYYQQQKNAAAALRVLYEYRQRKTSFTADELWTLAQLFESAHNYDDAARGYYALYNLGANNQERSLAAIANLLLTAPDQPIGIGSGDLSLYRDIATMDPGPGFLNGVLSLLFNSTAPQSQFQTENQASIAYFHRAKASELISEFDRRFPNSTERPPLHGKLIDAYGTYGDNAGVIRAGRQFLTAFPEAGQRTQVSLAMADAYARQNNSRAEFAIYEEVLKELATRADNVPLGENAAAPVAKDKPAAPARSPEYARVLDRYVGRLVALKRMQDALALYRREIGRNPNDPGLYERLAGFLDQNKLAGQVEQVYRQAIKQFQDPSWSHKLARWYLRRKQTAQFDALTRDVIKIFSGTELEAYLRDASQGQPLAPVLYRQVNLYAHQRFPNDLIFARNLLTAYANRATPNPVARETLLRTYWYYAPDLRDRFFELLSRTGKLKAELAAIQKPDASTNPAAAQFAAEAEAWQSHFENAAPLFRAVAAEYPGEAERQTRAASMYRSLSNTELAATIEQNVTKYQPRDTAALTRVGEIYADREQFQRAAPFWNRVALVTPGKPDGYIESATVFWDYYRFADALRLIADARQRLNNSQLFSYQAGAIYENQREYARAIQEYAKGALAAPEDPQSRSRLVQLARRPAQRALIDDLTAKAVSGPNATMTSIALRADVLNAQNRADDFRQLLVTTATTSTSMEVLQWVDQTAAKRALDKIQEQAKLREIALTNDPVERMQAQIELLHYYEGRKDLAAAGRTAAELYQKNPAVLGVIRASVDYYSRNKDAKRAVDILAQAAAKAQPAYRNPLMLAAARKSTEAGDYARARTFLATLLQQDPFQAQYVAAVADTYARQGDDKGLRDFYNDRLKTIQQASLSAGEKMERAAALRRGLVPVLTRLKDYAGAVDQYIEVLNRYPDDADLAQEVARYAASHERAPQLVAYYENTAKQSPRDFRWPLIEARVQTQLENFPAAVAAYKIAAEIRPDRLEFYTERAGLEERLLQFDEAAATYAKLYELNYHNSQWMERVAAVRARQGQTDAAVKALDVALIEGHAPKADVYFSAATRLESWNMLPQAKEYAEKGVSLAGTALLTDYAGGAQVYLRVMTRLRQYDAALQKLAPLTQGKLLDVPVWRAMGTAVGQYFTPEEKSTFATFASTKLPFVPMIQTAGLLDLQARLLAFQPSELVALQQQRLQFAELGTQLEAYWKQASPKAENRDSYLDLAATNYRLGGDAAGELRVLTLKDRQGTLAGPLLERFAELVSRTPQRLDAVVSSDPSEDVRNAVANYVVQTGNAQRSFQAVTARGRGLPPVWTRAYTALTGLYFTANTAPVKDAFQQALGNGTIGERLGKPVDRAQQLAGDVWFYYGSRYGEYLGVTKQADADDYLPSGVEARPGSAEAYFQLAEFYRRAGQASRALEAYRQVLQLNNRRADAHDRVAVILLQQGKRDDAVAEFRAALDASARLQDERRVAESFWTDLQQTLEDIGKAHALDVLRADAERVLRTYIRRNGNYRVDPLMQGAIAASPDPAAGIAWMLDLSRAAPEPAMFLAAVVSADWVPEAQRAVVYRALIDTARSKPELENDLNRYQVDFAVYLVEHKRAREAQAVLADIPQQARADRMQQIVSLEVRIAAQAGGLNALLNRYGGDPDVSSKLDNIRGAANDLEQSGNHPAARQVLEFVYTRQIEARQLNTAIFLGLAEIRLEQGDTAGALALLRRMTMVVGEPFDNLMEAANLLIRTGHAKEAGPFLEQRVKAVPWDDAARVQLAKLQGATDALRSIMQASEATYESRVIAARSLGEAKAAPLTGTSAELILLASPPVAPAAAEKPYFYFARIDAAAQATEPAVKIRLLRAAIAIDPGPEKPKLDLIRAALDSKRWQTAVAAAFSFEPTARPDLARGLAQANEALGDLERAQALYRTATSDRDVKRVQAILDRRAANEKRRPTITVNVEQDHPVRPRLVAASGGAQ